MDHTVIENMAWKPLDASQLPAVAELAGACRAADGGLAWMYDPENIHSRYFPDAPGAAVGAYDGERLAAFAAVHRVQAPRGPSLHLAYRPDLPRAVLVGHVRPDLRRQGLGGRLMEWSEAQARLLLGDAPPGEVLLQVATESLTEDAERLYRSHGFEPEMVALIMRRDLHSSLPDCPFPPGVTVDTWSLELGLQFYRAYYPAFEQRPGFPGLSEEEWIGQVVDNDLVPEWSLLASEAGVPLGFVIGCTDTPDGYIWQIGVVPSARRRGLASALLVESMRRMQAAGFRAAQLIVHTDNPEATAAYESVGFETSGRRARFEKVGFQII